MNTPGSNKFYNVGDTVIGTCYKSSRGKRKKRGNSSGAMCLIDWFIHS